MRFVLLICLTVLFFNSCLASDSECSAPDCINNGNSNNSTVILCNSCLMKSGSSSSSRSLRQKLKSIGVNNDEQTQITDLNFDELVLILEYLETDDILSFAKAESDPIIIAAVKHIFWNRYKDYTIHATVSTSFDIYINDDSKDIYISQQKGMHILKMIGNRIRYLEINSPKAFVSKLLNKYACDSLIKLELEDISDDTFTYFKHPFENVEELIFDYSRYNESRADQLPLNQLFPKLRRLSLYLEQEIDANFTFTTFQHLEVLNLNDDRLSEEQIQLILAKHPEIKSLSMFNLSQDMANFINSQLLNLENLTVSTLNIEDFTQFEHLKHLKVFNFEAGAVDKMSCPQIQSLEMRFTNDINSTHPWAQFLTKHQSLRHLRISDCNGDNFNEGLVLLTNLSESLIEITILGIYDTMEVDTFAKIIENNPKLERLCVLRANLISPESFHEQFGSDWNITATRDIVMERMK